jgi:ClpP class serine protease
MQNFRTLSAILRSEWAMSHDEASVMLPLVVSLLKGSQRGENSERGFVVTGEDFTEQYRAYEEKYKFSKPHMIEVAVMGADASGYQMRYYDGFASAPKGSVGIIPIQGVMMKNDYCGDAGTATTARRIAEANDNPNIAGVLLRMDTPGGMVDGLPTLYDAIANSEKPVVGFIDDGGCYSAGYYAASACSELYASHSTCGVGSIGTMTRFLDFKEYLQKEGIKVVELYAPQSSLKNESHRAYEKDGSTKLIEDELGYYANDFISKVKQGRGDKIKVGADHAMFKGDTFWAPDALEMGMIDGICSMQMALNRVVDLSSNKKKGLYV